MLFASPVSPELLDGGFYDREGSEYYTSVDKVSGDFVPIRFQRELRIFQKYCRSGRVLDVGCNTGGFLHQLRVNNPGQYEVVGADVSGPALEHARKAGIPVLEGPFDKHDFAGTSFEAVTFWAVLEHVNQPLEFLRKAGSVLKPQGYCFVLVPNMQSLAVRILGSRYRYVMPEHINYFTPSTLARMAGAAGGFETVELRSTHFNPVVLGQDLLRPRSHVPAAERAALLKRTNAWKSNPRLRPVQFMYKTMEAVLNRLGLADNLMLVLKRR